MVGDEAGEDDDVGDEDKDGDEEPPPMVLETGQSSNRLWPGTRPLDMQSPLPFATSSWRPCVKLGLIASVDDA